MAQKKKSPFEGAELPKDDTPVNPNDPFGGLDDDGGEFAPAFIFKGIGDGVSGEIESFAVGTTKYGRHPIVTLRNATTLENGKKTTNRRVAVHCLQTVLRQGVRRESPVVGELLTIRRLANRENATGDEYQNFRVDLPNRPKPTSLDALNGVDWGDEED